MNFNSIKEYFYKVYSYCFLIMLLPVALLGCVHFQLNFNTIKPFLIDTQPEIMVSLFLGVVLLFLTIVHLYAHARLKKIVKMIGLGNKMDHYFYLTIVRLVAGAITCCLLIAGYLVTQNELADILFFIILAWIAFQIPSSRKACKELKLKGDERTMVYFKMDNF